MPAPPPPDRAPDDLLASLWHDLGGPAELLGQVHTSGPTRVLPSVFDVTGLATATVAAANLAVAELAAARSGDPVGTAHVDRRAACAAFAAEALLTPLGWQRPPVWDPVAGDYPTRDGWVRLHTNYSHHREALGRALGVPADREPVAAAVARRDADDVEAAVVAAGGAAAAQRTRAAWTSSPAGRAAADQPLVARARTPVPSPPGAHHLPPGPAAQALSGVRVLDLTRVIAGPECTRFLAAHGADVLRIDPPGFDEVPALVPDTTVGKRCALLDLHDDGDRARFDTLVAQAHVLVDGYRPGALAALGYGADHLRTLQPALVVAHLDAYGWGGPWQDRRGFDSLVQMSTGITATGQTEARADRPVPLPVQALDHGAGFVLAAVVARALTTLVATGATTEAWTSLVGMAEVLCAHPDPDGAATGAPAWDDTDTVADTTSWGPVRRVPTPGRVATSPARWRVPAGPLGRHPAAFATS